MNRIQRIFSSKRVTEEPTVRQPDTAATKGLVRPAAAELEDIHDAQVRRDVLTNLSRHNLRREAAALSGSNPTGSSVLGRRIASSGSSSDSVRTSDRHEDQSI